MCHPRLPAFSNSHQFFHGQRNSKHQPDKDWHVFWCFQNYDATSKALSISGDASCSSIAIIWDAPNILQWSDGELAVAELAVVELAAVELAAVELAAVELVAVKLAVAELAAVELAAVKLVAEGRKLIYL